MDDKNIFIANRHKVSCNAQMFAVGMRKARRDKTVQSTTFKYAVERDNVVRHGVKPIKGISQLDYSARKICR
ncbi:hypothetical protein GCM10008023_26610 [Sphingomonas glacialis]|uniref:Uncharacterized protein n=1 Tax=Sphingomonas glacialis TaxID=658225 RepID=A0ABQ3LL12_9SPHN|nr:hypothetical protein GCM10008023_26610 [Sphingomonas glacialis]